MKFDHGGPLGWSARRRTDAGQPTALPNALARFAFCNGMTPDQRDFTLKRRYPEATRNVVERVGRRDLPPGAPRTWIMTTRDRAVSIKSQRNSISALGGVEAEITPRATT